ncbi:hypothetical protein FC40_GL000486 [Ligilactobacillus hayakitensis DSM 18933 = JCM 14209]|uniref:Bacterial toxin 24 domain-containing protein n=1 Tax=Ligilactobacillus hayakitensis DSM 18933 = JCM 14209 TaxID=1423755 RepID=A0A0R1WMQ0_9LACO|nr:hypothetical protein [Ligilactobacillus hayakitensis]KRM19192.1 hypothetical protein FC40_GL000486 [Ligilactobacillus hayakitensis DSM 18933 = JCM 14209]
MEDYTIQTLENIHRIPTSSKKEDYRNVILKVRTDNQIEKIRVFDEKGYVNKDYDLTDHGNSKYHKNPYIHDSKVDYKSGKIIHGNGREPTEKELEFIRKVMKQDE